MIENKVLLIKVIFKEYFESIFQVTKLIFISKNIIKLLFLNIFDNIFKHTILFIKNNLLFDNFA